MKTFLNSINLFLLTIVLFGCIDDSIIPPITGNLNSTAEMIVYFESLGDFPNSNLAPALVSAEEVHANLSNYLVIDVRDSSSFISGHIEGAVNVSHDSLYIYIKNRNTTLYEKIVLISENGHHSSYYACLLRLAGFNNVYTLNFGMASWNINFADAWLNSIDNHNARTSFNNEFYPKGDFTNLPKIMFENPNLSIQERVEKRIELFIKAGFNKVEQYRSEFTYFSDNLLVCYGKSRLYRAPMGLAVDPLLGHAEGTVHYADAPFFEFRAFQYLQTLPNEGSILIYDYNGQLSACMVAYLRVLGYDAISLEFGANQLFYDRMLDDPELTEYAFDLSDINDFSYVRGN